MARKARSRRSLEKEIGLIGLVGFGLGSLLIIPFMVGIIFAVAYMPFGVAILVVAGYLTRKRWTPYFRAKVRPFFAPIPKVSHPRERGDLIPAPVKSESATREHRPPSADLRDA